MQGMIKKEKREIYICTICKEGFLHSADARAHETSYSKSKPRYKAGDEVSASYQIYPNSINEYLITMFRIKRLSEKRHGHKFIYQVEPRYLHLAYKNSLDLIAIKSDGKWKSVDERGKIMLKPLLHRLKCPIFVKESEIEPVRYAK